MRGGSIYFFLPGTYSIMNGTNRRMRNREPWKQTCESYLGPSQIYLCHGKTDPESMGAAKRFGNRERCQIDAGCCSPPCAQCGGGGGSLGVGGIGSNGNRLQEVGRVCVRLQTKIPFLAQALCDLFLRGTVT